MKLTRNYYKYPLKYGEYPSFQDLKFLYKDLNLTLSQVAVALNTNAPRLTYYIKKYKLQKTNEEIQQSRSQQWQNSSKEYKINRSRAIKEGFNNRTEEQKQQFKQKIKDYMSNQTKEQKQKRIEKFKNTWNNRTEAQILLRKKRISESLNNRTIEQKQQAIEKFKISYHEQWLQKSQEQKDREISKMLQTKKIRNNLHTSNQEQVCLNCLKQKFNKIETHFKDNRYPFLCDFYIPEKDLFVECNFHWTHGKEPFNPNNEEHLIILEKWKEKAQTSKFYEKAIEVWTKRDAKKQNIAKQNNLNYLCFYTLKQFKQWITS